MDELVIRRAFKEKQTEIRRDMTDIYAEIARLMKKKPVERVTKEITIAEASELNAYSQSLEQAVRKMASEKMVAAGVPDHMVNIIWARAKRKTGVVQIELCQENVRSAPFGDSQESHAGHRAGKGESGKHAGSVVLASGAVVEIAGWVFIPGMGKFAAVIRGIGLVIMAAGTYLTYEEGKEKARIKVSEEFRRQESDETGNVIDSICEKQCQLNTSILCRWAENICEAVLEECRKESD